MLFKVSDIDGPLDLVLIFVPAKAVPQVLEDCVAKGVRGQLCSRAALLKLGQKQGPAGEVP